MSLDILLGGALAIAGSAVTARLTSDHERRRSRAEVLHIAEQAYQTVYDRDGFYQHMRQLEAAALVAQVPGWVYRPYAEALHAARRMISEVWQQSNSPVHDEDPRGLLDGIGVAFPEDMELQRTLNDLTGFLWSPVRARATRAVRRIRSLPWARAQVATR